MHRLARRCFLVAIALSLALRPASTGAQGAPPAPLRFLGEFVYPGGTSFEGTAVGELSGIVYDPRRDVYYAVADDRSLARLYTLEIDVGPQGIADVRVVGLTVLDSDVASPGLQPHEPGDTDLEDIVLLPDGGLLISSERDRNTVPWLRRYALDGTLLDELPLPDVFRPGDGRGTRPNLAFEAIALSPDGATLLAANEQALAQDGPLATPDAGTDVRLLHYDLRGTPRPGRQVVYRTEPIFARPEPPTGTADNGVTAMLWSGHLMPQYDILLLERSFVAGAGNDVAIFGVELAGATDVSDLEALPSPFPGRTSAKTRLVSLRQLGITPDNLEAMAFGPRLPNGRPSIIVMSDDNLSPSQRNQFLLFELDAPGLPRTGQAGGAWWPVAAVAVAGLAGGLARRRLAGRALP
jgi:LPXTG-motif cell wall-anchored protein